MRILRIVALSLLSMLTIGLVIGIGSSETGPVEKVVLGMFVGALVFVASRVGRLGRHASL
jgi:hypothetical protein